MLLKKLTPWIIACVVFCAACFISYREGVAATTKKHLAEEIQSLNKSISDLDTETKKAGAMNLVLHNTISARKKADDKSTQVFTNALSATAHLRFNCVFDDNIMQQLYYSADRADQAASSGLVSAMPTGDPPP